MSRFMAGTEKTPGAESDEKQRAFPNAPWRGHELGVPTLLTGCGFALAFGWLWFPALRSMLLPGLFASSPGVQLVAFGLAGAVPGIWWTARLLALGPGKAVSALTVAAFAALLLAWAISLLSYPASGGPGFALCALAAGNALALGAEAALRRLENRKSIQADAVLPGTSKSPVMDSPKAPPFSKPDGLQLPGIIAVVFFGLGSLNVLAPVAGDAGMPSAVAQAFGLAAAAVFVNARRPASAPSELPRRAVRFAACVLGACGLAVLVLAAFIPFAGVTAFAVPLDAVAALPEAAAVAVGAALCRERFGSGPSRSSTLLTASLFLFLTIAAVNGGYLAGLELWRVTGKPGPALLGLVATLPLGLGLYWDTRKRAAETAELAALGAAAGGQLTERELALARLLVRGHSNKAIAEALELTENTVRWHIKNLNRKTGAEDRAELIAILTATSPSPGASTR